jgi:hypothetical protein
VRRRTGVRTWPTVVALFGQFWLVISGSYGRFRVSVQARLDIRLSAKENIHAMRMLRRQTQWTRHLDCTIETRQFLEAVLHQSAAEEQ